MYLYKHQVEYYEKMVYNILEKDIGLILPKFGNTETNEHSKHPKRQIISALISGFIGLALKVFQAICNINEKKDYSRQ